MIRRAGIEDLPEIQSLAEIVFRQTYKDILSPEQMEYMMDMMYSTRSLLSQVQEQGNVFFLDDGRGYASIRYDRTDDGDRKVFHLEKLYVLPEFQKTGLGRSLFDTAVAYAREESAGGSFRIELNVNRNNPALGFYRHIGMEIALQGDFPIGNGYYMNDYIMALDF